MNNEQLAALERLAALKAGGTLTEAEFALQKARILDRTAFHPDDPTSEPSSQNSGPDRAPDWARGRGKDNKFPWLQLVIVCVLMFGLALFVTRGILLNDHGSASVPTPAHPTGDGAVQDGEYTSYESSNLGGASGNSDDSVIASLCSRINSLKMSPTGRPTFHAGFIALRQAEISGVVRNGGLTYRSPSVAPDGKCRLPVTISGIFEGSSVHWSGNCAVTSVRVDGDDVSLQSVASDNC